MAWQIYQLTNSPFEVGLIGLARALPQIGLTLFGGLLADALDRRRLMMVLQLCQCMVSSSLALLSITGLVSPTALLAAAVLLAFGSAVEAPNHQAIVPNLLPTDDLSAGIAFNNTLSGVARIAQTFACRGHPGRVWTHLVLCHRRSLLVRHAHRHRRDTSASAGRDGEPGLGCWVSPASVSFAPSKSSCHSWCWTLVRRSSGRRLLCCPYMLVNSWQWAQSAWVFFTHRLGLVRCWLASC